jgi:general secretion pathway protein J
MTGASRTRGFTLIEVLVALAIFGVMSALAYMTLGQTLNNSDMLNERMDRLQAIQRLQLCRGLRTAADP